MKHFFLLLLAVATVTACGTSRRVAATEGTPVWEGRTTSEILQVMGDPDRIDSDGKDGSILVNDDVELRKSGVDVPLDALSDEECAGALVKLLTE